MEPTQAAVGLAWSIPFMLLLAAIAAMPFVNGRWWEKNHRYVALGLGSITAGYYLLGRGEGERVVAALHEYASFIALVGSLFVIAGGIHITIKGRSTPRENLLMLLVGAVVANLLGTTGASMLLVRPYLRNNGYRLSAYHVIFFIFVVSNIGGALTPIGDPPLLLGFLRGVPFFWVTGGMLLPWLAALAGVLGIFWVVDSRAYAKVSPTLRREVEGEHDRTRVTGLHNVIFLAIVIGAVFIERPVMLREGVMIGAAVASYFTTKRDIHRANHFSFHPVEEVAWLFAGIFVTMMPALDWLAAHARSLGLGTAGAYYWGAGGLSSVLDNAPTYLNFLSVAIGRAGLDVAKPADVARFLTTGGGEVLAISAGAVFFGAMTYIGNGPNFMVKAIAEHRGVHMPGFFGYIVRYSLPVLLPVFFLVWLIFFS